MNSKFLGILFSLIVLTLTCNLNYRPINGSCISSNNNGMVDSLFIRYDPPYFQDNISIPFAGPPARLLSNTFLAEDPRTDGLSMYETTKIPFKDVLTGPYPEVKLNQLLVGFGQAVVHDIMKSKQTLDSSLIFNPDFRIPEKTDPLCQIIYLQSETVIYYFTCTTETIENQMTGTTMINVLSSDSYIFVNDTDWSIKDGPLNIIIPSNSIVYRDAIFPLASIREYDEDSNSMVPVNGVTSFLDLSIIYGSTDEVNMKLRANDGSGKLLTSPDGDAPFNTVGVPNECGGFDENTAPNSASGDARVDVSPYLTAIHSLYFRTHNIDAEWVVQNHPEFTTDEEIFQKARTMNIARYQRQVYEEYLPTIFGRTNIRNILGEYKGYNSNVDPRIDVAVDIALRILHSQVMMPLSLFDDNCNPVEIEGTLGFPLHSRANCIFTTFREVGTKNVLKSAISQSAQKMNGKMSDLLRNIIFRVGHNQGTPPLNLDIEMLNIFRGRELGVQNFDTLKYLRTGSSAYRNRYCNVEDLEDPIHCFYSITTNHTLAGILKEVYGKVNKVDTFIGLTFEKKDSSQLVGKTTSKVVLTQMKRTRDADPYFYLNVENLELSTEEYEMTVETLSETISRLFEISIGRNAFKVPVGNKKYCNF